MHKVGGFFSRIVNGAMLQVADLIPPVLALAQEQAALAGVIPKLQVIVERQRLG